MSATLLFLAGAYAMAAMWLIAEYTPPWLAVPVNLFIWLATAYLCGAMP